MLFPKAENAEGSRNERGDEAAGTQTEDEKETGL